MSFAAELRRDADELWEAQLAHPFVRGIGDGTLPEARFRHYVAQDYCFLVDYGRLLALGVARAPDLPTMRRFAELTQAILVTEMDLHRTFAAGWGLTEVDLLQTEPTAATRGYVDFLLRTSTLGDLAELVAALLPCMWSYAEIGERLAAARAGGQVDPGRYGDWVDTYAGEDFRQLAAWCRELTDRLAADRGPDGRAAMHRAFRVASEQELRFWESCWRSAG